MILIATLALLMPQAAPLQDTAKKDKGADRLICRNEEPPVGTHMRGRRVCMTAADWDASLRDTREGIDRTQDRIAQLPINRKPGE
jgi:hypothetical protein